MKVIFVTRGYPSKDNLMSGNYEAVQAKALVKLGVDVSVFCVRNDNDAKNDWIDHFTDDGVKVYIYKSNYSSGMKSILRIFYNHFFYEAIYKLYLKYVEDNGEVDLIHAHIVLYASYCKNLLRKKQIPLVITEHWSRINYPMLKDPRLLWWGRFYSLASQVIAVSGSLATSLRKKFGVESLVIGNMVESHFFKGKKSKRDDDLFKFVAVGNLVTRKGFDLLIEAFAQCKFNDKVQLQIVGGGVEYNNLQNQISRLGLQHQVIMMGVRKPNEVSRILEQTDCYVLSSHVETFGIVCIEAMAKGLPVIATACHGPEDYINDENGMLIPTNNIPSLRDAMLKMRNDFAKYDCDSIRKYCNENFSEEAIAKKIIDVYKKVLNKQN